MGAVPITVTTLIPKQEKRAEQEKRARAIIEQQIRNDIEYSKCVERRKNARRARLAELYQQKQEIEKQVLKEDEYNLYVAQQIIEKMCLARLRKEYTDHSYILYEKLLEDIDILEKFMQYYEKYL